MAIKKRPILDILKMQGILNSGEDNEYIEKMYDDIIPILMEIKKNKNKNITTQLKNYVTIRLITWIETELKNNIIEQIDKNDLEITKLFSKGEITIPLKNFKILKNRKITEGKLIATNFNFQNP